MLSGVFCARLVRHISPHALSRIRGAIVYADLAYTDPAAGYSG